MGIATLSWDGCSPLAPYRLERSVCCFRSRLKAFSCQPRMCRRGAPNDFANRKRVARFNYAGRTVSALNGFDIPVHHQLHVDVVVRQADQVLDREIGKELPR